MRGRLLTGLGGLAIAAVAVVIAVTLGSGGSSGSRPHTRRPVQSVVVAGAQSPLKVTASAAQAASRQAALQAEPYVGPNAEVPVSSKVFHDSGSVASGSGAGLIVVYGGDETQHPSTGVLLVVRPSLGKAGVHWVRTPGTGALLITSVGGSEPAVPVGDDTIKHGQIVPVNPPPASETVGFTTAHGGSGTLHLPGYRVTSGALTSGGTASSNLPWTKPSGS